MGQFIHFWTVPVIPFNSLNMWLNNVLTCRQPENRPGPGAEILWTWKPGCSGLTSSGFPGGQQREVGKKQNKKDERKQESRESKLSKRQASPIPSYHKENYHLIKSISSKQISSRESLNIYLKQWNFSTTTDTEKTEKSLCVSLVKVYMFHWHLV